MSAGGCGDIDPTIVFLLKEAGLSFSDINHLLCNESGFPALVGRPCTLDDLVSPDAPEDTTLAKRLLRYQIIKQIGGMIPLLGRVDSLAFACEKPRLMLPFILDICDALAFLGLRYTPPENGDECPEDLSVNGSSARVFVFPFKEWAMMKEELESLATNKTEDRK